MNRSEWAERLPLIQAFVEGKTIECRNKANSHFYLWVEVDNPAFDLEVYEYRIKPEPKVSWVVEEYGEVSILDYEPSGIKFKKYVEVVE